MADEMTSTSHPIRVDWLPVSRGMVGLTFAPGKKQRSAQSGSWNRDLDADLERLRLVHRADRLVCLLEDDEMIDLGISNLVNAATAAGVVVHRFPIPDGQLPGNEDAFARLVTSIVEWAESGERVVIHCKGGLGRAGTLGGCVLVACGWTPLDALRALRDARGPDCPETESQRGYIMQFARDRKLNL